MDDRPTQMIVPMMKAALSDSSVPPTDRPPVELPSAATPVTEPFAGGLLVTYVLDLPDRYEFVAPRHCAEMGLAPGELRMQAVVNLRMRRRSIELHWYPDAKAVALTLGGDLEAGLILDDGIMNRLASEVGGDLVVTVPARDILVATGTAHADGLAKLRWVADRIWEGTDHLLTRDLLVRRDGEWSVFEDAAA